MKKKLTIKDVVWSYNTTIWKIERPGFVDAYYFFDTSKFIYKNVYDRWIGSYKLGPIGKDKKSKYFKTEHRAIKWLLKR